MRWPNAQTALSATSKELHPQPSALGVEDYDVLNLERSLCLVPQQTEYADSPIDQKRQRGVLHG